MRTLGRTSFQVFPLCLGGNVFGWTADESESFRVLDAYAEGGGNFIDTADVYSEWVSGHSGGESESIIGAWMAARKNRDRMIVATKVGMSRHLPGLAPEAIRKGAEASLRRLRTDRIDLYFAHRDDANTPIDESLRAFDALVREGKVRHIAASNYTATRLTDALEICDREGLTRFTVLQPHYNLMHRSDYEGELRDVCARAQLACVPYFSLAKGFLTGKYRPGSTVASARAKAAREYLDERGIRVLAVLDEIAGAHGTTVAAVALAWLAAQPTVAAPIASARTPEQVRDLLPVADLRLSGEELVRLSEVSARLH